MFRSKTVFVLGAGSSKEVNLPLGEELKRGILTKLSIKFGEGRTQSSGDRQIVEALKKHARGSDRTENISSYFDASIRLCRALPTASSIDNLLATHPADLHASLCGKLAIISTIVEKERSSWLFVDPRGPLQDIDYARIGHTWFPAFFRLLQEGINISSLARLFENVSFINFNYDRCIEYYLYDALKRHYWLDDQRAAELMQGCNIFRPYGKVGKLPWQRTDPSAITVDFGSDQCDLIRAASQIKTFGESLAANDEINAAKETIAGAERLVFLGFAFHRQNVELISPGQACLTNSVFATTLGVSESDSSVIDKQLRNLVGSLNATVVLKPMACCDFFKEFQMTLAA